MNKFYRPVLISLFIFMVLTTVSCGSTGPTVELNEEPTSPAPVETSLPATVTPETVITEPYPSVEESATPTGATEAAPEEPEPCGEEVCAYGGFFLLERPIGPEGRRTIDHTSRFGTFRTGSETIRGVYFLNSTGTPVLAAGDGVVVVAGDDSRIPYGRYRGAYGNLVILEHDLPGVSEPVYTLYGHLSQVSVDVDDQVKAGQEIGLVGSSGDISGSTLYFEVRHGENLYQAARNPELWLKPVSEGESQSVGALAGRIINTDGNFLTVQNIILEQLAGPGQPAIDQFYIRTYGGDSLVGLEPWEENFAIGGLPTGEYQISFLLNGMRQQVVEVHPDQVTVVAFEIE